MAERYLNRTDIEAILPHRGRALLLDSATVTDDGAVGFLTIREDIVEGHFPGYPVMRGFDRAEMIIQTLGIAASTGLSEGLLAFLVRADGLSFRNPAELGDLVRAEATIIRRTSRIIEGKGVAYVGDKIVAEAALLSFVVGKIPK